MRRIVALCAYVELVLTMVGTPVFATNLLVNSGFEAGSFAGWIVGGNSTNTGVDVDGVVISGDDAPFTPSHVNVRSGAFAGYSVVQNGIDPVERILLEQTVAVVADSNYSVGFWLGNDSRSIFGYSLDDAHMQIFVNGVGLLSAPITNFLARGSTSADFFEFSSVWASGSATSAMVVFAINGSGTSRVGLPFDDFYFDGSAVPEPFILALVDIKPGSFPNSVNLKSKGVLPVAILGTADFDVTEVDFDSLRFGDPLLIDNGGTAVSPLRSGLVDFSGDGFLDLTLKFSTRDLVENEALGFDTVEGHLSGLLKDGTPFAGMDSIRIVPPNGSNGNSLQISAVPEPTTCTLALAALCFAMSRRRAF